MVKLRVLSPVVINEGEGEVKGVIKLEVKEDKSNGDG